MVEASRGEGASLAPPAAGLEMWQATRDVRAEARNRVPVLLVDDR